MLESALYDCPYCGERIETSVDLSGGDQNYVEDCQVCCRPITFVLQVHEEVRKSQGVITDAAQIFNMGRTFKPGAVADPQEMGRRVIPAASQTILPCHCLFIGQ